MLVVQGALMPQGGPALHTFAMDMLGQLQSAPLLPRAGEIVYAHTERTSFAPRRGRRSGRGRGERPNRAHRTDTRPPAPTLDTWIVPRASAPPP